jgi:pilus assembly protein CpaB
MNPRQRRGVLFMLLAVLVAGGVFLVVLQYLSSVASAVGPTTTVYRASGPLPAYATLTPDALVEDEVPTRWLSDSAQVPLEDLLDRRVGVALAEGTMVTADMLVPPSDLSPTEREIAIEVDAVTGIAGRVEPGDFVDIYAVFADVPGLPQQVRVLVRSVRVVTVAGERTVVEEDGAGLGEQQVIPVTLALEPNDALAVTYADAFAAEVRLVGLPAGTAEDRTGEQDRYDAGQLGGQPIPEGVN